MDTAYAKLMEPFRRRMIQQAQNKYYQSMNQKCMDKLREIERNSLEEKQSKWLRMLSSLMK